MNNTLTLREPYRTYGVVMLMMASFYAVWFSPAIVHAEIIPGWADAILCDTSTDGGATLVYNHHQSDVSPGIECYTAPLGDSNRWVCFNSTTKLYYASDVELTDVSCLSGYDAVSSARKFDFGGSGTTTIIYSSSTTGGMSSITAVDNPNQNLFNGFLIFFLSAFGTMWVLRRRQ